MPRREPSAYVWDIRDACASIQSVLEGLDEAGYLKDEIRRLAVERLLITVGEAAGRLAAIDPAMSAELGDIAQIVAFRNVLVHGYFKIDHARVWKVLQTDVPALTSAANRVWQRFAHLYDDNEEQA